MVSESSLNKSGFFNKKTQFLAPLLGLLGLLAMPVLAQPEPTNNPVTQPVAEHWLACQQQQLARLEDVEFEYVAELSGIKVASKRWLDQTESGRWRLQSKAHWLFLGIEERSVFALPDWQLHSFKHERQGMSSKHNVDIRVDDSAGQYSADARDKIKTYDYQGLLYDELNHQLRLQMDLACAPEREDFTYHIAKRKGIKAYRYQKLGEESVKTEAGTFQAIKLEKLDDESTTVVWLAKELAYAVVKLVHEEDGDRNSLSIKKRPRLNAAPAVVADTPGG